MFPFGDSKSNGFHQILREVYSHRSSGCGTNTTHMYITIKNTIVAVVHSLSPVQLFATRGTAACQVSPSFTISPSLLKLMSIESVMPSISSSVIRFSSCLQCFPASGSFPESWFFASSGQSIGASASIRLPNPYAFFHLKSC